MNIKYLRQLCKVMTVVHTITLSLPIFPLAERPTKILEKPLPKYILSILFEW